MPSRVYSVVGKNLTLAAQATTTLAFINPGTTASIQILRAWASQNGTVTAQQIGIQLSTQVTAFPTLVSVTPGKMKISDPTSAITGATNGAAGTCGVNASAEGAGAKTVLFADAFNNLNGWTWVPTPDEQIFMTAGASSGLGLVILTQPTTLSSWNFGFIFAEV